MEIIKTIFFLRIEYKFKITLKFSILYKNIRMFNTIKKQ